MDFIRGLIYYGVNNFKALLGGDGNRRETPLTQVGHEIVSCLQCLSLSLALCAVCVLAAEVSSSGLSHPHLTLMLFFLPEVNVTSSPWT